MGTSADVLVGATGEIYAGPAGTALPTTAAAVLNAAFVKLGFVSEDGVTMSISQDTNEIKAWGGSTVRKVQTSHLVEVKAVLLETNPGTVKAFFGTGNFDDALNRIEVTKDMNERGEWIIDTVDGSNKIRLVIPDGEVTGHGDVVFKTDSAIGYEITITCYEDASSVKVYEYLTTAGIS